MKPNPFRSTKRHCRRGATLLDVAIGSMLLALLLIPSVHLISESQSSHRRLEIRDTILYEAEQLVESNRVALSEPNTFDAVMATPVDVVAAIPVSDGPDLTSRLRIAPDASMPTAKLLNIDVDVWQDLDGDSRMDTDELRESVRTQWAAP